jgi:hypothetical protein
MQGVEYCWVDKIRDRRGIRCSFKSDSGGIFAYHNFGGSKELDKCHLASNRSKSRISRNQRSTELLGKHDVRGIIGRKIVPELPNAEQEDEMRIPSNTKIEQITDRLLSTTCRDDSLQ